MPQSRWLWHTQRNTNTHKHHVHDTSDTKLNTHWHTHHETRYKHTHMQCSAGRQAYYSSARRSHSSCAYANGRGHTAAQDTAVRREPRHEFIRCPGITQSQAHSAAVGCPALVPRSSLQLDCVSIVTEVSWASVTDHCSGQWQTGRESH